MYFFLSETKAHRNFKEAVGHANHFLVTLELGLDALATHGPRKDSYFYPMWNPKNAKRSGIRSEEFLLGASLSWAVDSLDGYFNFLVRSRRLIPPTLRMQLLQNARSIQRKIDSATELYELDSDYRTALVHLIIQWRNNIVHLDATNALRPQLRQSIQKNAKRIYDCHRKLDVSFMLEKFDEKQYPEFRDATSLLRGLQLFLLELDRKIVSAVHIRRFLLDPARKYFNSGRRYQKLGNVLVAGYDRRTNYCVQVMKEFGLSASDKEPEIDPGAFISMDEMLSLFDDEDFIKKVRA